MSKEKILKSITNIVFDFEFQNNPQLLNLYYNLTLEEFIKVNQILNGSSVRSIKRDKIDLMLKNAIIYYYREIENKTWDDIEKMFEGLDRRYFEIKIKNIKNNINYNLTVGKENG